MDNMFFIIILAILIFDYLFERILSYLNISFLTDKLPVELEGIYDAEKYRKSQQYLKANSRFGFITSSASFIAIMLMLFLGGFAFVDSYVRQYTANPIFIALLFFGIIGVVADILSTPFSIYDTFVIEEKFGFNKTTAKTFILDKLKGWAIGALIGGGLLSLIIWIYSATGNMFWVYAWIIITAFTIFMTMFYSTLIVPLFNKQTPLEEGALRNAIEEFAKKAGFKLNNIFVIDGSKRSAKSNAYFSGIGSKKRIVLYDTLIKQHTTEELVAVLAHEIGHYKLKHTLTGIFLSVIQTGLMLFIMSFFIQKDSALSTALCRALGTDIPGFHIGILAFGIMYSPLSFILSLFMNLLSRKHEYAADRFAGVNYNPESLKEALKKLSVENLSNLIPHPAYVFFYYSHPTLLQRLKALSDLNFSKV
jgi:STE24 endopeptidase